VLAKAGSHRRGRNADAAEAEKQAASRNERAGGLQGTAGQLLYLGDADASEPHFRGAEYYVRTTLVCLRS
jgi:hypothetical protein